MTELRNWIAAGEYTKIINGNYQKRGNTQNTISEDILDSFEYYKNETEKETDPVLKAVRNLGEGVAKIGDDVSKVFKDFFR